MTGKPGPRVRITSDGVGCHTKVYVGDQMLTNCQRIELVIDASDVTRAILHLVDIDVDVETFSEDTVVMVQPVRDKPAGAVIVNVAAAGDREGIEMVRALRRLAQKGIRA